MLPEAVTDKISELTTDLQEPEPFFAKYFQEAPPGPLPENDIKATKQMAAAGA